MTQALANNRTKNTRIGRDLGFFLIQPSCSNRRSYNILNKWLSSLLCKTSSDGAASGGTSGLLEGSHSTVQLLEGSHSTVLTDGKFLLGWFLMIFYPIAPRNYSAEIRLINSASTTSGINICRHRKPGFKSLFNMINGMARKRE